MRPIIRRADRLAQVGPHGDGESMCARAGVASVESGCATAHDQERKLAAEVAGWALTTLALKLDQRKTLLVTLLKDKVAIRSALHTATSCEVHAFLGDA